VGWKHQAFTAVEPKQNTTNQKSEAGDETQGSMHRSGVYE
jgi:hypothetical protein